MKNGEAISIQSSSDFLRKIGFRYALHKSLCLDVAATYECCKTSQPVAKWLEDHDACWVKNVTTQTFYEPFSLRLANRVDGPAAPVYDIGVASYHTFLAEGVVVSNCIPSLSGSRVQVIATL